MKKFAFISAAVAALFVLTGSPELSAQNKKGSAKAGTIELVESKDGKFRFSVRDADGKYLAGSPVGHATEKEAREAAESLRTVIATAKFVSKKSDTNEPEKKSKDKDKN